MPFGSRWLPGTNVPPMRAPGLTLPETRTVGCESAVSDSKPQRCQVSTSPCASGVDSSRRSSCAPTLPPSLVRRQDKPELNVAKQGGWKTFVVPGATHGADQAPD